MERTKKTLVLPTSGSVIEYYTYITAGEFQKLQEVLFPEGFKEDAPVDFKKSWEQQRTLIEKFITGLDGSIENLYDRILELPSGDYIIISDLLGQLINPKAQM